MHFLARTVRAEVLLLQFFLWKTVHIVAVSVLKCQEVGVFCYEITKKSEYTRN